MNESATRQKVKDLTHNTKTKMISTFVDRQTRDPHKSRGKDMTKNLRPHSRKKRGVVRKRFGKFTGCQDSSQVYLAPEQVQRNWRHWKEYEKGDEILREGKGVGGLGGRVFKWRNYLERLIESILKNLNVPWSTVRDTVNHQTSKVRHIHSAQMSNRVKSTDIV